MSKSAFFRFYGELNDFLPSQKGQQQVRYEFSGSPAIKDAIQALGVPQVEVFLIQVNGEPTDFAYNINIDDQVSVYPLITKFTVEENPIQRKPILGLRFVLDCHLGKLARHIRMLGFDTLYRNDIHDDEIVKLAELEDRIVLTRDLAILKCNAVTHGYYPRSQDPEKQLEEIITRFDLMSHIRPFSRCMDCNGYLENVEKELITHKLEPLTRSHFDEFLQCDGCGKVYWKGSHYERMCERLGWE